MQKPNPRRKKIESARGVGKRRANQIIAEGPGLENAKLRKEQATANLRVAQSERAQLELEVARGKLIPKAQVEEEGIALGMAAKAQLFSWVGSLPGRLEGLTASQMVSIFDEEIAKVLKTLASC
jgi:hypothetical protein